MQNFRLLKLFAVHCRMPGVESEMCWCRLGGRLQKSHRCSQEGAMRGNTLALAVILACSSGHSGAQTSNEGEKAVSQEPAPTNSQSAIASRYSFNRVDNGFIR